MAPDVNDSLQSRVLQSTLAQVAAQADDGTDVCVVCLDQVSDACETRPCRHRHFDYHCLINWLFQKLRCPLCQTGVSSVVRLSDGQITSDFPAAPVLAPTHQPDRPLTARSPRSRWESERFARGSTSTSHRRAARRSFERPWGVAAPTNHSEGLRRRQDVYKHERYSKHVGSNRVSNYRELTPQLFTADDDLTSRARIFIRRELKVFAFLNSDSTSGIVSSGATRARGNSEFLLEYIIAVLKSVDMMGSAGQAEDLLSDFLGRSHTRLFLHELRAWLRSPYSKLEDWDRAVQYGDDGEQSRSHGSLGRDARQQGPPGPRRHDLYRPKVRHNRPGPHERRAGTALNQGGLHSGTLRPTRTR